MRLIDANALNYKNLAEVNGRLTYVLTAEEIDNAPSVEVGYLTNCANCERVEKIRAKRPQGEWIDYDNTFYKCPECGYLLNKYCPQCQNKVIIPKGGAE